MMRWGLVLLGAGGGMILGVQVGESAMLPAYAAVVLGLALLAAARSRPRDLIADARVKERPVLNLGSRVEDILKLAEEQAADTVAEARSEADRIVAEARAEAARRNPE
ncbi:hypothetical protein OHA21_10340 [Actinoplanes sp. NBC_00393]|uniref:hypothetical protein n=1 Tax=Actinoplanes sp. NBC_00393 TaxID=2975953 RepID=UPI002E250D36